MKPKTIADIMMLSVTVIWGVNFSVMKGAYAYFNPLAFTMLRFLVAVIAMFLILKLAGYPLRIERRDLPALVGFGILSNTVYQVLFVIGLANTRAGNAGLLTSSSPVFAYLTGVLLKREPFHKRILGGILLSVAGVAAVVLFGSSAVDLGAGRMGDLLVLLSAMCWGAYTGSATRLILKYGALRLTAWVMLTGTVGMIFPLLPFMIRQDWAAIPVQGWLGFLYSAILTIVYGYITWSFALQHLGVARTVVYSNITPLLALLGGWALLGERPTAGQLSGVAMILTGVLLVRVQNASQILFQVGVRAREAALSRKKEASRE